MKFRVHGVQFDSGIIGGELPVDGFDVIVLPGCPSGNLLANFVSTANGIGMTLKLHQPLPERLATGGCITSWVSLVIFSASSAVSMFSNVSSFLIQNELDYLRFTIDNDVGLHGMDYFLIVVTCCVN